MITVFNDDFLRVLVRNEPSTGRGRVLLSFTGIGHGLGGVNVQKVEFFGAGRPFKNVLFISDLKRSWGNSLNFDDIQAILAPYIEGHQVFSIGNSMGGFLSVVATNYFKIKASVSLVPQFSVSPDVIPEDRRWGEFRKNIVEYKFPSLEGKFNYHTKYFIFSGNSSLDAMHWKRIPKQSNIINVVFPDIDHNLASFLKADGILHDVVAKCFAGEFSVEWLSGASSFNVRSVG